MGPTTFREQLRTLFGLRLTRAEVGGLVSAFDLHRDGMIDAKEFAFRCVGAGNEQNFPRIPRNRYLEKVIARIPSIVRAKICDMVEDLDFFYKLAVEVICMIQQACTRTFFTASLSFFSPPGGGDRKRFEGTALRLWKHPNAWGWFTQAGTGVRNTLQPRPTLVLAFADENAIHCVPPVQGDTYVHKQAKYSG